MWFCAFQPAKSQSVKADRLFQRPEKWRSSVRPPSTDIQSSKRKPGYSPGFSCLWKQLPAESMLLAALAVGDGVEDALGCFNLATVAIAQRILADKGLAALLTGIRSQRVAGR
jgi:hypothetical protein